MTTCRIAGPNLNSPYFADLAMVSVLGLLLEVLPLLQHLGVGEGDPVDPLEGLHVGAALPVCGGVLGRGGGGMHISQHFVITGVLALQ